jgi:hypothetical protein
MMPFLMVFKLTTSEFGLNSRLTDSRLQPAIFGSVRRLSGGTQRLVGIYKNPDRQVVKGQEGLSLAAVHPGMIAHPPLASLPKPDSA